MNETLSLRDRWRLLGRFAALLWTIGRREMPLLAGFALASGLLPLLSLSSLQRLVDGALEVLNGGGSPWLPLGWLAALIAVEALQTVVTTRLGVIDSIKEALGARVQERLLRKASRLPLAAFEQPEHFDQLQRAYACLQQRFFTTLDFLLPVPTYLLVAASLLWYISAAHPFFPLVILLTLLPSYGIYVRSFRGAYWLNRQHIPAERMLRALAGLMIERQPAAEVRLFEIGDYLLNRYQTLWRRLRDDRLALARKQQRTDIPRVVGKALSTGLVAVGLVVLIARGQLSVGAFAAYLSAAEQLGSAFAIILWGLSRTDSDLSALADLFDYLDLPDEDAPDHAVLAPLVAPPLISMERVSFTYPGSNRPALREISLQIRPGERIALVGVNGAGKSTLARLLLGLYQPTGGQIMIDEQPLNQPTWWREQVSAVVQDYGRYACTARENIGFGRLALLENDAAISEAAARSGADAVIAALPEGYATPLGATEIEGGQDLSVGQWQKLAIGRAYLRGGVALVLDEPTAALDAQGEVEVYRQFSAMSAGKTVILISHRLGSARIADRIVVLEDGRIIEEGHHRNLVAAGGRYAELYALQASWYE